MEQSAIAGSGALVGLSGLGIGQHIGPYHIVAELGMGEVYRAHDRHLEREVAIKRNDS